MSSNINITKKDVIWNYVGQFFSLTSGLIVLPLILKMLSPDEVGMNYLMLTISSIVILIDFGFGPQFGRNFSYVYSGAQEIVKEGVKQNGEGVINYHLLAVLLETAKKIYRIMSTVALILMLTFGTLYVYKVTAGFSNIENSLLTWVIFSFSTYFNVYFGYYTTLLKGSGLVAEASQAMILSKTFYLLINIILLYVGFGLLAVAIANTLSPFVQGLYCRMVYFTKELKDNINININKEEITRTFNAIWYNAKKLGVCNLGAYGINKMGMFLVGLYLPLSEVSSYGLLIQLATILTSISSLLLTSYLPQISGYRVSGDKNKLISLSSFAIVVFWILVIVGSLIIVIAGDNILSFIGSKTVLPSATLCGVYLLICALEANHSNFATLITTKNEVPFVKAGLISGGLITLISFIVLQFTNWGLWAVVLTQGIVQISFNNWYWPQWVLKDFNIGLFGFVSSGMKEFLCHIPHKK